MLELKAKIREKVGSGEAKKLRESGFLPGVIYAGGKSRSVTLNRKEFEKVFAKAGESSAIALNFEGKKDLALIYEVAQDPVSDMFTHVDFLGVHAGEKIKAHVPLVFVGFSEAEKAGGILIKNIQEVEVEAKIESLPNSISVDMSVLKNFEDNIYIKDLVHDSSVKILENPTFVVMLVKPPRSEAEIAEAEAPAEFKPEEIKVESEEKRAAKEEKKLSEEQ